VVSIKDRLADNYLYSKGIEKNFSKKTVFKNDMSAPPHSMPPYLTSVHRLIRPAIIA
jgi:hypothetical protein